MATPSKIVLTPETRGEYAVANLTKESANAASKLLQKNHDEHDIIFNDLGFHNHITHHLFTIFTLGATPDTIQKRYDGNAAYQRPPPSVDDQVVQKLYDPEEFIANLCNIKYYPSYFVFFQREMEEKGYERVVNEYVFKGDERANIMFARLFAGTLHPLIHFGFGIEFEQPEIIAEALAQTAIHPPWSDSFFFETDEAATQANTPSKPLVDILAKIRADKSLSTAARWDDQNQMRDGPLARARQSMVNYASQWRVDPENLEEATAEMINAAVYFTGGAQHPPKQVKFDFYFMHSVNASIFFPSFMKQTWISKESKAKMIEYKGRMDLLQYASRRSPMPLLDEIVHYKPKCKDASDWNSIIERVNRIDDDGHASKLVRALAHGEQFCKPWEKSEKFRIKGGMWLQLGNMAIDSVEDTGERWVRSPGFDEAWTNYVDRPQASWMGKPSI